MTSVFIGAARRKTACNELSHTTLLPWVDSVFDCLDRSQAESNEHDPLGLDVELESLLLRRWRVIGQSLREPDACP